MKAASKRSKVLEESARWALLAQPNAPEYISLCIEGRDEAQLSEVAAANFMKDEAYPSYRQKYLLLVSQNTFSYVCSWFNIQHSF